MSKKRQNKKQYSPRASSRASRLTVNATIDSVNRYFREGRMQKAESVCRQLLKAQPNNMNILSSLGQILCQDGRPGEAVEMLRSALKRRADAECYNSLGVALRAVGEVDNALKAFEQAVKIRPKLVGAFTNIADVKSFTEGDAHFARMEKLVESKSTPKMEKMRLHFALAKIFDDLADFNTAFSHLSSGNQIKRESFTYDIAHQELLVERIISVFSKRFLRSFSSGSTGLLSFLGPFAASRSLQSNVPPARSIFIVGMPRSGTTLVEQIISSHSQVCGAGEHNHLKDLVALSLANVAQSGKGFPDNVPDVSREALEGLGKDYLDAMQRHCTDAQRIVDKTPMNFLFVGLIWMLWPTARVIHCVRDPMATCYSCYTKLFSGDQQFSYDLTELGRYYRSYARLMKHWHSLLPGFVLDVKYEDLVAELKPQTARIVDFCDLPWEQECLQFHSNKRPVMTASAIQVRRPIYATAVAHWRNYDQHLGDLVGALGLR